MITENAYDAALSMFARYGAVRRDKLIIAWSKRQGLNPVRTMDDFEHVLTEYLFGPLSKFKSIYESADQLVATE